MSGSLAFIHGGKSSQEGNSCANELFRRRSPFSPPLFAFAKLWAAFLFHDLCMLIELAFQKNRYTRALRGGDHPSRGGQACCWFGVMADAQVGVGERVLVTFRLQCWFL
ncbi:MAG: hypothetical protein EB060_12345 [Proteobacteria bacterium]|nr:hypothetical protein [Pseudomonadota bacterium]